MNTARAIAILVLAVVVGLVGYQIGVTQNIAAQLPAASGAPVPYYYPYHWGFGFGFGIFGFLFWPSSCSSVCFAPRSAAAVAGATATATCMGRGTTRPARAWRIFTKSFMARSPQRLAAAVRHRAHSIPAMKTVLVVDDEPKIVQLTRDYLEHAGFRVASASDGKEALASFRRDAPDLVVLDLGLPTLDGLDVARAIRKSSNVPIVMLTGRGDETDRVAGLELGADDYVTKPFSPKELVARVRAVLRRSELASNPADVVRAGDVTLDVPRLSVKVKDRGVELTPTEFQLLLALARSPGRVFTRAQLLDAVHGVAFESYERAIDAHVKNIRRKLEPDPREPRYLLTVHGVGYRFADEK